MIIFENLILFASFGPFACTLRLEHKVCDKKLSLNKLNDIWSYLLGKTILQKFIMELLWGNCFWFWWENRLLKLTEVGSGDGKQAYK